MKRLILTGILVLATGFSGLMADKKPKKDKNAQDAPATAAQPAGPRPKSQAEAQALQAMLNAQDPDTVIKCAEDVLTRFADTEFKDLALLMEAKAWQQKGDFAKAQIFAERSLDANAKSYDAQMLLGELLASHTGEHDFDKEEKLTRAEKLLNDSIAGVTAATKPNAQVTDAQWEEFKKARIGEAHNGLGLSAMTRKKYDVAVTEFQQAVAGDPQQPAFQVRLAQAELQDGKYDDAVTLCDKVMGDASASTQVKQVAQAIRSSAMTQKNGKK